MIQVTMGKEKDVFPLVKEISPGKWPKNFPIPKASPAIQRRPARMKKTPIMSNNFPMLSLLIPLSARADPNADRQHR